MQHLSGENTDLSGLRQAACSRHANSAATMPMAGPGAGTPPNRRTICGRLTRHWSAAAAKHVLPRFCRPTTPYIAVTEQIFDHSAWQLPVKEATWLGQTLAGKITIFIRKVCQMMYENSIKK